jgi:hypothetical protein
VPIFGPVLRHALVAGGLLGAFGSVLGAHVAAQDNASPPNFSTSSSVGWVSYGPVFIAPTSGPGPVVNDAAHPFIPNAIAAATGAQPTFPVADLTSPILQPWAREELRKRNELILSGKPGYTRWAGCWPIGVPGFVLHAVQPTYFIQTAKQVVMVSQEDFETRHIYLNVPHSANVKPSWQGESIGHYEGDTLVVDTIGMNDQTWVDNFRTPHTDKLHVVERFRLVDNGMTLQVDVRVDDPGAFTAPWAAIQRFRRVEPGPMFEASCAENSTNHFNQDLEPIPEAKRLDF